MDNSLVLTSNGVENQQYQNILLTSVQRLWTSKQMLDITFQADGEEIQAHQLVLAAASSDLCDALTQIQKTTKHAVLDLNRSGITMAGLKELLNYLYCGKMKLNAQLCQDVSKAAKTLHIPQVVALCALFRATFMPGSSMSEQNSSVAPGVSPILNSVWKVEQPKSKDTSVLPSSQISPKPGTSTGTASLTQSVQQLKQTSPPGSQAKPSVDKSELRKELSNHKLKWLADPTGKLEPGYQMVTQATGDPKQTGGVVLPAPVPSALVANIKQDPSSPPPSPQTPAASGGPNTDFSMVEVKKEPEDDSLDSYLSSSPTFGNASYEAQKSTVAHPANESVAKSGQPDSDKARNEPNSAPVLPEPKSASPLAVQIKQEPLDVEEISQDSSSQERIVPVSFVKVTKVANTSLIGLAPASSEERPLSDGSDASDTDPGDSDSQPTDKTNSTRLTVLNKEHIQAKATPTTSMPSTSVQDSNEYPRPVYYKYKRKRQRRGRTHYVKPQTIESRESEPKKPKVQKKEDSTSVRIVHVPLPTGATLVKPFAVSNNGKTAVEKSAEMRAQEEEEEEPKNYPAFPSAAGDQVKTYVHVLKPPTSTPKEVAEAKDPVSAISKGVIKTTVPAAAAAALTGLSTTSEKDDPENAESLASCFVRARGIKNYKSSYTTPHSLRNYDAPNSKYRDCLLGKAPNSTTSMQVGDKKLILLSSVVRNGCKGRFHISCILCHFLFSSVESCEKHILRKHFPGELIFADTLEGKAKLEKEKNTPEDKKTMFLCSCCGFVTHNERFIYIHRFYQHEVPILQQMIQPYCDACELLLNNDTNLEEHSKLHRNHYICNTCYKRYICLDSLCQHVREAHSIQGNTELFIRQVTYD